MKHVMRAPLFGLRAGCAGHCVSAAAHNNRAVAAGGICQILAGTSIRRGSRFLFRIDAPAGAVLPLADVAKSGDRPAAMLPVCARAGVTGLPRSRAHFLMRCR